MTSDIGKLDEKLLFLELNKYPVNTYLFSLKFYTNRFLKNLFVSVDIVSETMKRVNGH
jgi:hypothetical protein